MNAYRKKLGEIWSELTGFLDRNEISNFSIWNAEDLILDIMKTGITDAKEKRKRQKLRFLQKKSRIRLTGFPLRVRICG